MLPELQLILTLASTILVSLLVIFYFFSLHGREKELEKKESAVDTDYHHVVDEALSKERKIIDDATAEAGQIITQSKYLTTQSQKEVTDAIKIVITEIQRQGSNISREFASEYTNSLRGLTSESLKEFQIIMTQLQTDLKKQNKEFQDTLLPEIQKEVESYKKARMQEVDQAVTGIVQKASQEIFNKSISMEDHQTVVTQSLEKAKKEGLFS